MIDKLHEDCLIPIFQKLDFIDRVRLEAVCYKWFRVLQVKFNHQTNDDENVPQFAESRNQMQASYANVTRVNVADFLENDSSNYFQQEFLSFAPTVIGVVKRCGRYVRSISFGQRWFKISQAIIDAIAEHCTRLTELDLGCVILDADISVLLERIGENLESFSLEETSWVNNEDGDKVQNFFQQMKKLKRINLRRALFKLDKLYELPPCLESIEISGARSLPAEIFNAFLVLHPNLTELEISPLPVADDMTISYISDLRTLRNLQLGYIQKEARDFPMEPIAFCNNLQCLHILASIFRYFSYNKKTSQKRQAHEFQNCNALTGQSLRLILESLVNLRSLAIIGCSNVFDYSPLSQCRQLESLNIGHSLHISDEELIPLAAHKKLRSLTITKCFNISNNSILTILHNCILNDISLVNCEGITDEVLYSLASNQHEIETISVQGCICITSKGVAALALMKNITKLRELDISHNRNIDDMAILSIHNGIKLERRKEAGSPSTTYKENQQPDDVSTSSVSCSLSDSPPKIGLLSVSILLQTR
ncbi:unnamed protein product [Gongylonema pulchrum]|uniref:F-box domain-containing protein n=1 Tax=Gongylonema pulchrum TaxID=637853 RepID=A0A183CXF7_9BILA|nr:unnamed protein product [Gongylonema pulchrum]